MSARYLPPSHMLRAAIEHVVPFAGSHFAEANLRRLIAMTRDGDVANRDWAVLLLAQLDQDGPDIRQALMVAAGDTDFDVRAGAILGLAQRDKALALPLLRGALWGEVASIPLLEAAIEVADPSLAEPLRAFAMEPGEPWLDTMLAEAIAACSGEA